MDLFTQPPMQTNLQHQISNVYIRAISSLACCHTRASCPMHPMTLKR